MHNTQSQRTAPIRRPHFATEANRKELELVMRYTHEQGLVKRRLKFEELFHPSTLGLLENKA